MGIEIVEKPTEGDWELWNGIAVAMPPVQLDVKARLSFVFARVRPRAKAVGIL